MSYNEKRGASSGQTFTEEIVICHARMESQRDAKFSRPCGGLEHPRFFTQPTAELGLFHETKRLPRKNELKSFFKNN